MPSRPDLERLAADPAVRRRVRDAFPDVAAAGAVDRRTLLQLVAATLATGGLAGCDGAVEDAPLLSQAQLVPGVAGGEAIAVATTLERDGHGIGVLATSRDGRAIRLDGNPLHPASGGALDVRAQAAILGLHDPDRAAGPTERGAARRHVDGEGELDRWTTELTGSRGAGAALLLPPSASPTQDRLLAQLAAACPDLSVHRWDPLAASGAREGAERAFGQPLDLLADWTRADCVLSVGGDPFSLGPAAIRTASDWAARRRDRSRPLPRLLAVETAPSLAGLRADRRVALPPRDITPFLRAVLATLDGQPVPDAHPDVVVIAAELRRAGPAALVAVGPEQPAAIHALAHAIHDRLGSHGTTIRAIAPVRSGGGVEEIAALSEAIAAGRVGRLLILGGNPAYDAPADLDLPRLLAGVPDTLCVSTHRHETARLCRWHLPEAHPLESFGDARAFDGTASFRQPAQHRLRPVWSAETVLARLAGDRADERALLRTTWAALAEAARFDAALEAGIVAGSAAPTVPVRLGADWDRGDPAPISAPITILFAPDPSRGAGEGANNGWLQEMPHPVTKQVWGNAALLGEDTARRLGLSRGDRVTVAAGARGVTLPAWPLAGHAEKCVTLPLGFGRVAAGRVGDGIGTDVGVVRVSSDPWITGGTLARSQGRDALIATQTVFDEGDGGIVRHVASRESVLERPGPAPSLYPEPPSAPHRWGMAIDMDACIGCNACALACQAENNVATVGPAEAARDRTMHWLRIDRYDTPDRGSAFQPVPCMHCEAAPCEVVCPVNATVHSSEGLNDMVYSRCIGTRTCSNNCPWTVRRFNFTDPREGSYATPPEALNPQVTLRVRGVMEKCTFCVQRIAETRIAARLENRPIRDGEIVTACQSACPTRAITFGDLADPTSAVSRAASDGRNYALLGHLNTRPRTTYLARIEDPTRQGSDRR